LCLGCPFGVSGGSFLTVGAVRLPGVDARTVGLRGAWCLLPSLFPGRWPLGPYPGPDPSVLAAVRARHPEEVAREGLEALEFLGSLTVGGEDRPRLVLFLYASLHFDAHRDLI
jgi:hypothetical protein